MPRKLKVFRTPIGFHDAYVAAPTKKAALAAWGSEANLFARGVAEEVTDPKLTKAPLATPGEVVKVARGTAAEHVAALGKAPVGKNKVGASAHPTPNSAPKGEGRRTAKPKPPKPKPSRAKLDAAEAALGAAETAQAAERTKLEKARDAAERAYAAALAKWRG